MIRIVVNGITPLVCTHLEGAVQREVNRRHKQTNNSYNNENSNNNYNNTNRRATASRPWCACMWREQTRGR